MAHQTKVAIEETEGSLYSAAITVGNHHFTVDEPETFSGGGDLGPSPFDLLTSSLAACTIMTVRWYATQKDIPLEKVSAEIFYDQKQNHFTKKLSFVGARLTQEQEQNLLEIAAKCPVQRALTGDVTVETLLQETLK